MKKCSGCRKIKAATKFHRRSARPSGRQSNCKECVSKREKQRYASDPKGEMERSRAWRRAHPRKAKALARAWYQANRKKSLRNNREWVRNNRERRLAYDRVRRARRPAYFRKQRKAYATKNAPKIEAERLRRQYGTTPERIGALMESQRGLCAICVNPFKGSKGRHIDHDHKTGAVRGLLCQRCNMALGLFDDSPSRLIAAAAYLERT